MRELWILCLVSFVLVSCCPADNDQTAGTLQISEYVEGSGYTKALELYNGSNESVDLADYQIFIYHNGATYDTRPIILPDIVLSSADVYVIGHSSISQPERCDLLSGSVDFNGDDAIALMQGMKSVDIFGRIGEQPDDTGWGGVTTDHTLRRKAGLSGGDPDGNDSFDPAMEWDILDADILDGLGFR